MAKYKFTEQQKPKTESEQNMYTMFLISLSVKMKQSMNMTKQEI